jgi:hypothetical protein
MTPFYLHLSPAIYVSVTGFEACQDLYASAGDGTKPTTVCCSPKLIGEVYRVLSREPRFRDLLVVPIPGLPRWVWFMTGPNGIVASLAT